MTDDRWHIKGSDRVIFERFRKVKRDYDEQLDGRVTDERTIELLLNEVPIERDSDTEAILEKLEELDDDVARKTAEMIVAELR